MICLCATEIKFGTWQWMHVVRDNYRWRLLKLDVTCDNAGRGWKLNVCVDSVWSVDGAHVVCNWTCVPWTHDISDLKCLWWNCILGNTCTKVCLSSPRAEHIEFDPSMSIYPLKCCKIKHKTDNLSVKWTLSHSHCNKSQFDNFIWYMRGGWCTHFPSVH